MLWVNAHYKCFTLSVGIDHRRQMLTSKSIPALKGLKRLVYWIHCKFGRHRFWLDVPANTRSSPNVGIKLGQRIWHWLNVLRLQRGVIIQLIHIVLHHWWYNKTSLRVCVAMNRIYLYVLTNTANLGASRPSQQHFTISNLLDVTPVTPGMECLPIIQNATLLTAGPLLSLKFKVCFIKARYMYKLSANRPIFVP